MSSTHISLRSFTNNTDLTQSTLVEVYGNERSTIYHITNDPFLPIIKTSDVTVTSINSSPWHMEIQFKNKKDISNIKKIESSIVSLVENRSDDLFGELFTSDEIYNDNVIIPSLSSHDCMKIYCLSENGFTNTPNFALYEPSKCAITLERLVPHVICRCALKPWYIQIYHKTRRFRVVWTIEQCMILEEPINTDCILDADELEEECV